MTPLDEVEAQGTRVLSDVLHEIIIMNKKELDIAWAKSHQILQFIFLVSLGIMINVALADLSMLSKGEHPDGWKWEKVSVYTSAHSRVDWKGWGALKERIWDDN